MFAIGVADQLQTNYASDLRHILKCVFEMNVSYSEEDVPAPATTDTTTTPDNENRIPEVPSNQPDSDPVSPGNSEQEVNDQGSRSPEDQSTGSQTSSVSRPEQRNQSTTVRQPSSPRRIFDGALFLLSECLILSQM